MATRVTPLLPPAPDPIPADLRTEAIKIARGFVRKLPRNVDREDLEQAALIGLFKGLRTLSDHGQAISDPKSGWYLRVRIRGSILDELRAQDWLPRRTRAAGERTGEHVPVIVRSADVHSPLDYDFEQNIPYDGPSPEDLATEAVDRRRLAALTSSLPPRLARIVQLHYGRGARFLDIAHEQGVSEPRISQLHARAIALLRDKIIAASETDADAGPALPARNYADEHRAYFTALKRQQLARKVEPDPPKPPRKETPPIESHGPHRTARAPESGSRPAQALPSGIRASRLGSAPAPGSHRASPGGSRGPELGHAPRSDCYHAPPRSPEHPARRESATGGRARDAVSLEPEPEPERALPLDWFASDSGGVAMSAEARSALPVSSTLPEGGLDLRAELARYEEFLIDQALVRALGNRAQAAKLLGLNRTTLVEMLKRRARSPLPRVAFSLDTLTLRERMDALIAEVYEATGYNITETARQLGIGRTTFYRRLRVLDDGVLDDGVLDEGVSANDSDVAESAAEEVAESSPDEEAPPETEPCAPEQPEPEPDCLPTPIPAQEPEPEPPTERATASKSEPPTGVYTVRRTDIAALRAEGLTPKRIANRLGVSRYLVERALRTPAPPTKCGDPGVPRRVAERETRLSDPRGVSPER